MSRRRLPFWFSLALLALGLFLVLRTLGWVDSTRLWAAWPLVLLIAGLSGLLRPAGRRAERLGGPERLLVAAVTVAGLTTWSSGEHSPGRRRGPPSIVATGPPTPMAEARTWSEPFREGARLTLEVSAASVEVSPGPPGRIGASLAAARGDGTSVVWTDQPSGERRIEVRGDGGTSQLTVQVPDGTAIRAQVRDGHLMVEGAGSAEIDARGATIEVSRLAGSLRLDLKHSVAQVAGVAGSLSVEATGSSLHASAIAGTLLVAAVATDLTLAHLAGAIQIDAADGSISIDGAAAGVQVTAARCALSLRRLASNASVEATLGDLLVEGVEGTLGIAAHATRVEVRDARGSVDLTCDGRSARLSRVQGDLRLTAAACTVAIAQCNGSIGAELRGGTLLLERNRAPAEIRLSDGDLRVDVRPGAPVALDVTTGSVDLRLDGGARIDLTLDGGTVMASRAVTDRDQSDDPRHFAATIGNGAGLVSGVVRDGLVRISLQ